MIAEALGKSNFKGSVGWLEKWKKRFSIKYFKICGESGDPGGNYRFLERSFARMGPGLFKE